MTDICCPTCGHALDDPASGVRIDPATSTILSPQGGAKLTPTMMILADLLVSNMPEFVCNKKIHEKIWGCRDIFVSDHSIISAVKRLRVILEPIGLNIENRWGVGYRLRLDSDMEKSA